MTTKLCPGNRGRHTENSAESLLLRCGRHSGAESITVEGYRQIKILGKKGDPPRTLDHATTIWLTAPVSQPKKIENLKPMGWVSLKAMTDDLRQRFADLEESFQDEIRMVREQAVLEAEQMAETRRLEAEKAEKVLQDKIRAEAEEQKRQTELEAMPPEYREVMEVFISTGPVVENKVIEIYQKLDGMNADLKAYVAGLIKAYWVEQGKWSGVKKKTKQFDKVVKIKGILGER
jgi:hypothetical protein